MMKRCRHEYKDEDVGHGFCVVLEGKGASSRDLRAYVPALWRQQVGRRAPDISDLEFSIRCDRELFRAIQTGITELPTY